MASPLVSVIIPCYNGERFLETSIPSVTQQTHQNLEILVVDDGSTDRSLEMVRRMAATDSRLVLLERPHSGGSAARNFALDRARGTYVAFLDCDDFWAPQKIERHVKQLETEPAVGISYSATQFVAPDGRPMRHRRYPKIKNLSDYYLYCRNPITTGSSAVFRREIFDHHRFDETLRGYQDVDCWLRIAFAPPKSWRFEGLKELLTYYRVHPEGISQDFSKHYESAKRAWAKSFTYAPEVAAKYAQLAEAFQLRFYARRAITQGNARAARETIFAAIKTDPRILLYEGVKTAVTLAASFVIRPKKV